MTDPKGSEPAPEPEVTDVDLKDKIELGKRAGDLLGAEVQTVAGALQYGSASLVVAERTHTELVRQRATLDAVVKAVSAGALDERRIAAQVAAALLSDLEEVVAAAVSASEARDAKAIASAVVSEISTRLAEG